MAGWRIEASGGCIRLAEGEAAAEICRLPGGYRARYASASAEAYQPGDLYREVEDAGGRILARAIKLSDLVEFAVSGEGGLIGRELHRRYGAAAVRRERGGRKGHYSGP